LGVFTALTDESTKLEERWRNSVPLNSAVQAADESFSAWCSAVVEEFQRLDLHPLTIARFEGSTPLSHQVAHGSPNRLLDAADDMRQRREIALDIITFHASGGSTG
jgi:hypothetical protein